MDIILENITHYYDDNLVLDNVSLKAEHGELVALLGPSGCGKTTLLKIIAGLIPIKEGKIHFGESDVSNLDPRKRNAVMVFQNYALFPHLTVEKNIDYGLRVRKTPSDDRKKRVEEIMATVKLKGLKDRKISELSGGQQQRVALARALVVRPDVLLFDEPLSNLDEKLRISMRQEIRRILKEADTTGIYVTHDQEEAMSIADKIAVMEKGVIKQIGSPKEVYENPSNRFVAEFMGKCNFFDINGSTFILRPNSLVISKKGSYSGKIKWIEYLGGTTSMGIDYDEKEFVIDIPSNDINSHELRVGDMVAFDLRIESAVEIVE